MIEALLSQIGLSQYWAQKLGWTLLHFLWQGTVIAIAYALLRRVLGRWLSPQGRYALACVALLTMAVAPLLTFFLMPRAGDGLPSIPWNISASVWQRLLPGFVAVWMAGVVVFWIRLFGGWRFTSHLRAASYPAPNEWQHTLDKIAERVKTSRPVRLLVSSLVEVPTVIGWLRPVILLPVGALTGLPLEHVTALLAHELAHIRRHDYVANILQSVAESVLFYHPAVWWVSEQIRAERELCCDDVAVAVSGDVLTYAHALARLESIQPARFTIAHAANGGSLVNRVRRLIDPSRPLAESLPGAGAVWAMTLLLVAGAGVATVHATQVATSVPVALARTPEPILVTAQPVTAQPVAASNAMPNRVANRVIEVVRQTRDSLLFDPFLPAQLPPTQPVTVIAPRVDAAENHLSARAATTPSPVLSARAELPPPNRLPMPVLHAESRMVQIEVSVRDSEGRSVEGLSKQDFSVMDSGKTRGIDIFSADASHGGIAASPAQARQSLPSLFSNRNGAPPPSAHSTAIVVDHTNGDWDGLRWSRQAALDLVQKGMPDERIALYVVGRQDGLILAQDYTNDRELLLKSMQKYVPGYLKAPPAPPQTSYQAMSKGVAVTMASGLPGSQTSQLPLAERYPIGSLARPDEEASEDTVEDVRLSMRALAEHLALVPGRKSVFWVSEGFRPSAMAGKKWRETADWQKTITALNEADVAVNVIDTIVSSNPEFGENRLVMKQIADETGGRVWSTQNGEALSEGIEDSRRTYTLGFYLAESDRDDQFHALQVRVNRPGVKLSYRQGYYAGKADMPDPATEKGRNGETLETVLLNQVDSTGVGITALVDVAAGSPHNTVDFRINLDPGTLSLLAKNEGWTGKVEEMLVELNAEGRTLAKVTDVKTFEFTDAMRQGISRDGVTWHLSGPLAEGATKITLAVRDTNSGHVGSLTVPLK